MLTYFNEKETYFGLCTCDTSNYISVNAFVKLGDTIKKTHEYSVIKMRPVVFTLGWSFNLIFTFYRNMHPYTNLKIIFYDIFYSTINIQITLLMLMNWRNKITDIFFMILSLNFRTRLFYPWTFYIMRYPKIWLFIHWGNWMRNHDFFLWLNWFFLKLILFFFFLIFL